MSQQIEVGDRIRSVETNWHGKVVAIEEDGMLKCKGINFWDGEIDEDDTQWFVQEDVYKASSRTNPEVGGVNALNLM